MVRRRKPGAPTTGPAIKPNEGLAFRLPPEIAPQCYRLHIQVDPGTSRDYTGEARSTSRSSRSSRIGCTRRSDRHEATISDGYSAFARSWSPRRRETIALLSDEPIGPGKASIRLVFSGTLRSDLRGLYGAQSGERRYAFSQLEAADARRFFPCFDEPSFKARYSVSVTTRATNEVISNGAVERTEPSGDHKTVHFKQTPLLSTYLVALAVGELSLSEPVYAGDVPIRVAHIPGNEHLTGFALEAARESLLRLADYFDVPYAYEKLDLVAVPDFEIGAMENAGAVFFRETLLLIDEQSVSLPEKKRAAEVICHELAHMWYGNWSRAWWDDRGLTRVAPDAFASREGRQSGILERFGHERNSALHLDAIDKSMRLLPGLPRQATQNSTDHYGRVPR